MLQRRDIEIAQQHHRIVLLRFARGEEFLHAFQEVQLVGELVVGLGIGNVAARRHIEIVQLDAILQGHAHVAGMAVTAEILHAGLAEGRFRKHRHAVIGLLAVNGLVGVAQLVESELGKQLVHHLGLLQTQDIRLLVAQKRVTRWIRWRTEFTFQVAIFKLCIPSMLQLHISVNGTQFSC